MANIDRIANVQISLKTAPITEEGFNTILVAGYHPFTLNRVNTYLDADSLLTDGFSAEDAIYKAVNDAFSQIPRPSRVKVGRRQVNALKIEVKAIADSAEYKVTIGKKAADGTVTTVDFLFTSGNGATATAILTGLSTAIGGDIGVPVTASVSADRLVLAAKTAGAPFSIKVSNNLRVAELTPGTETLAESMLAIKNEDNDWYGWGLVSRLQADIIAAADWAEGQRKLFGCAIAEAGAKDAAVSTDTGSKLRDGNYFRSFWFYHKDAAVDFPEFAIMAKGFSILPGGETWANKQLGGVNTDPLSETEALAVQGKNGNTFERFRNISITQNGKTAGGEWIDVIRFRDWLEEDMKIRIFRLLVNSDKIPYTDGGIARIEAEMRASLKLGQDRGGIAPTEYDQDGKASPGFVVKVPLNYEINPNDKANRVLKDVKFNARLAGAIHVVNVYGSLAYENLA